MKNFETGNSVSKCEVPLYGQWTLVNKHPRNSAREDIILERHCKLIYSKSYNLEKLLLCLWNASEKTNLEIQS